MKHSVVALLITAALMVQGSAQISQGIRQPFRESAEEVLDCLDGAILVDTARDEVFYPQALKCRAMLRKLGRSKASAAESELVDDLLNIQRKTAACHILGSESCTQWVALRAKAVSDGALRVPGTPGE